MAGGQMNTSTSPHSVSETAERAVQALASRGVELFARIDHAGAARAVGLELADEVVLVFGNPRGGTLLMQADPRAGYSLPLRLLVWDAGGETIVGYLRAAELLADYELAGKDEVMGQMDGLLEQVVGESVAGA